jgi:hypothetical protein
MHSHLRRLALAAVSSCALGGAAHADSLIGLELVGPSGTVTVGQTFPVTLRAKREPATKGGVIGDKFIAVDCILDWDPTKLKLMGLSTAGSVPLLSSSFPSPSVDYTGINEAAVPQDGDALYYALAQLGNPVTVPTTGVQIVTFNFRVESSFLSTDIQVLDSLTVIEPASSVVYDGTVPGLDVTGTLSAATISQPFPNTGDLDGNGIVDGGDLAVLLNGWGSPGPADLDDNGTVNGADLAILLNNWGSVSGP